MGDDGDVTEIMDQLQEGRDLLRRGVWSGAREVFARALAAAPDVAMEAAAAEGVAEAAWWQDDDTDMSAHFEQAYRCYRAAGENRGAARAATWLGGAALQLRGEAAVAQGWFQRAERLLEGLPEGPEQGLLAVFEGMAARHRGEIRKAIEHADRAIQVGRRLGSPDLEVQGMALSGMAHVGLGQVVAGMRLLDEAAAAALAGEVHELASVWLPSCYLVEGCEQARDWERAEQWCVRVMDFCQRFDLGSPFSRCRTHYSTVLLWRGDWAEAEHQLLRAAESLSLQRPLFAAEAWARLGELRRRQGRWDEAAALFRRGLSLTTARIGQAALRLDQDDPEGAVDIAQRALDGMSRESRLDRSPLLEILVRAATVADRPELARPAVTELTEIATEVGIEALKASALWVQGLLSGLSGDRAQQIVLLGKAVALFEGTCGPYDAARARLDLARALLADGRAAPAADEALVAEETFEQLGATLDARRASSLVGRARHTPPSSELTERQLEILRLLAVGLTNKEVAQRLAVSEHTVKRHVANILTRLGVPSRAAAVAYASRVDLL
jgi:DNA-binding CsgD family transcriptional regulator